MTSIAEVLKANERARETQAEASAIAKIKADAWDEGYRAGDEHGYDEAKAEDLGGPDVNKEPNPYRSNDE